VQAARALVDVVARPGVILAKESEVNSVAGDGIPAAIVFHSLHVTFRLRVRVPGIASADGADVNGSEVIARLVLVIAAIVIIELSELAIVVSTPALDAPVG
jgi:hypothetical protein